MTRDRWALVAVSLLSAGCAKPPGHGRGATFLEELKARPQAFVAEVAAARGLALKKPVPIKLDDDRAFARALDQAASAMKVNATGAQTKAFYFAFNFPLAEPGAVGDRRKQKQDEDLIDEQLIGFFEESTSTVHVRTSKLERMKDPDLARFTVAHEVGHALQQQHFGAMYRDELGDDARLTRKALFEGDAQASGLAYLARRNKKPARRAMARAARFVKDASAGMAADDPGSKALREAPANERARLVFPYSAGFAFASDVHRVGGFSLLDKVFSRPPESTEQILHPDKYLSGEGPIPVHAPAVPKGFELVAGGQLGELMTGVVLEQCAAGGEARKAAEGWGGDAWAVAGNDSGALALLWSTVWDDEASAERFEATLRGQASCWQRQRSWGGYTMASGASIERKGRSVAMARGLSQAETLQAVTALLQLPAQPKAAVAPFGPLKTIPVKPPAQGERGRIVGVDRYSSELLGLQAPILDGYTAKLLDKGAGLMIKQESPTLVIASLGATDEPPTPQSKEASFAELIAGFQESGARLQVMGDQFFKLPLGDAHARTWALGNAGAEVRAVIVPICRSTGAIFLLQAYQDGQGKAAMDWWLQHVTWTAGDEPPICSDLDP